MKFKYLLPFTLIFTMLFSPLTPWVESGRAETNANAGAAVQVFTQGQNSYEIHLVRDGKKSRLVTVGVENVNMDKLTAKLSPDGTKVAYLVEAGADGSSYLTVTDIENRISTRLFESTHPTRTIIEFSWSHDSNQLAYELYHNTLANEETFPEDIEALRGEEVESDMPTDDLLIFTSQLWMVDLKTETHSQIMAEGVESFLGWTSDDKQLIYAHSVDTTVSAASNANPEPTFDTNISKIEISSGAVTDILNPDLVERAPEFTHLIDYSLLDDGRGGQKLAIVGTALSYMSLPITDTAVAILDITPTITQRRAKKTILKPILTSSQSIVNVTLSPDGSQITYMTENEGQLWKANLDGTGHQELVDQGLAADEEILWDKTTGKIGVRPAANPNALQFRQANDGALVDTLQLEADQVSAAAVDATDAKSLNVPFMHQLWDTPNWFGGYCACGPTSTAMALAYFGKIAKRPMTVSYPYRHTSNYGFYVAEKHGSFKYRAIWDCDKNLRGYRKAYGLYGYTIYSNGFKAAAYANIVNAIKKYGLSIRQDWTPTFNEVKAALNRGNPVIIGGTTLTSAGHIALIKGYTNDGRIIVHDPFGNFRQNGHGAYKITGANSYYYWNDLMRYGRSKTFNTIEVKGNAPGPDVPGPNLAKGKKTNVTSYQDWRYTPRKGNDGSTRTRYSTKVSRWLGYQNYIIDFGRPVDFDQIVINWEAAYGKTYHVGWSNNGWNYAGYNYTRSSSGKATHNVGNRKARYIRIQMKRRAPRMNNYSFWEVEVYKHTRRARRGDVEDVIVQDFAESDITIHEFNPDELVTDHLNFLPIIAR